MLGDIGDKLLLLSLVFFGIAIIFMLLGMIFTGIDIIIN